MNKDPLLKETQLVKKKSLQYIPYIQDNWKIMRQEVEYEDGTHLNSISSLWILDNTYPVELVTLDDFTPNDKNTVTYNEGDKLTLRSTNDFYPASESLTTEMYDDDFPNCNEGEFRMFARIYSELNYTGVIFEKKTPATMPWFKFGNIVCAKITPNQGLRP